MYDKSKLIELLETVKETSKIDSKHFGLVIGELKKPENDDPKKVKIILAEEKQGFYKTIHEKIVEHAKAIEERGTPFADKKIKENLQADHAACKAFLEYYDQEITNGNEFGAKVSP